MPHSRNRFMQCSVEADNYVCNICKKVLGSSFIRLHFKVYHSGICSSGNYDVQMKCTLCSKIFSGDSNYVDYMHSERMRVDI